MDSTRSWRHFLTLCCCRRLKLTWCRSLLVVSPTWLNGGEGSWITRWATWPASLGAWSASGPMMEYRRRGSTSWTWPLRSPTRATRATLVQVSGNVRHAKDSSLREAAQRFSSGDSMSCWRRAAGERLLPLVVVWTEMFYVKLKDQLRVVEEGWRFLSVVTTILFTSISSCFASLKTLSITDQ